MILKKIMKDYKQQQQQQPVYFDYDSDPEATAAEREEYSNCTYEDSKTMGAFNEFLKLIDFDFQAIGTQQAAPLLDAYQKLNSIVNFDQQSLALLKGSCFRSSVFNKLKTFRKKMLKLIPSKDSRMKDLTKMISYLKDVT